MRWRLYIFLLSATAAFCFMLLTAVTDYGTGGPQPHSPLISAMGAPDSRTLSARRTVVNDIPAKPSTHARHSLNQLRPKALPVFVSAKADPVMARHESEREDRANRGKPSHRNRLKWDDAGWYREEVALVTAYCPCSKCCGTQSPGITSIGKNAWTTGLAADPLYLEYGTRVLVPGYGLSEIDDTGGAMRRHWRRNGILHIDVRMTYHYEARQWGTQYLRVKIYDEE